MTHPQKQSEQHSPSLLGGLPLLSGAIAAITAVATVMAMGETVGYFSYLGAGWILPLLSFSAKVNLSTNMIVGFAMMAMGSLVLMRQRPRLVHSRWAFVAAVAVFGLIENAVIIDKLSLDRVRPEIGAGLSTAQEVMLEWLPRLWATSGAWLAVLLFERSHRPPATLPSSGSSETPIAEVGIVLFVFLVGLTLLPEVIGKGTALRDMRPSSTALPVVQMPGLEGTWHLLVVLQANGVLIRLPARPHQAETRVVPLTSVALIQQLETDSR